MKKKEERYIGDTLNISEELLEKYKNGEFTPEDYEQVKKDNWSQKDIDFEEWLDKKYYFYPSPIDATNGSEIAPYNKPKKSQHVYLKDNDNFFLKFSHSYISNEWVYSQKINNLNAYMHIQWGFYYFGKEMRSDECNNVFFQYPSDFNSVFQNLWMLYFHHLARPDIPGRSYAMNYALMFADRGYQTGSPMRRVIEFFKDLETDTRKVDFIRIKFRSATQIPEVWHYVIKDRVEMVRGKKPDWAWDIDIKHHIKKQEEQGKGKIDRADIK